MVHHLLLFIIAVHSLAIGAFNTSPILARTASLDAVSLDEPAPSTPSASLPGVDYGLTDEQFTSWLTQEVENCPGRQTYASVYEDSIKAIVQWRRRYRGNPLLWKRIFKKDRVIKELVESAPIIEAVKQAVEASENNDDKETAEKFTIIDLCSGKGYLSMFLSEILPQERVERFILVDKAWAIASKDAKLKPHHMNWDHIYGMNPTTNESYFTSWEIPLYTSKQGEFTSVYSIHNQLHDVSYL